MAWETRGGSSQYYTRSKRVGGKIVREYIGGGPGAEAIASLDQAAQEMNQLHRSLARLNNQAWQDAHHAVKDFCKSVEAAAREALEEAGYHRHDRGQWRKKRMPRNTDMPRKTKAEIAETLAKQELLTQEEQDAQLIWRAKEDGTVPRWQIRQALDRMPSPPRSNLKGIAEDVLVAFLASSDPVKRECMRVEIDAVRRDAAGPNPSPLEALLADRVAICWAQMQIAETLYSNSVHAASSTLTAAKRAEMAERRYLSAIKALAQIRRMQLPCVQVNIAGTQNIGQSQNIADKQVNVNGP